MALRIGTERMDSDEIDAHAEVDEATGRWRVSWLPGDWTKQQAITALLIVQAEARGDAATLRVQLWRAELGIGPGL